jgi:hypothetical protein
MTDVEQIARFVVARSWDDIAEVGFDVVEISSGTDDGR